MALERIQKKFVLLRYRSSNIWKNLSAKNPDASFEELVDQTLGINAYKNINRWISDGKKKQNIDKNRWSQKISELAGIKSRSDLFDDEVSSSYFAECIGLSRYAAKYLVDMVYAEENNLFESIIYNDDNIVKSFIDLISGIYIAYLFISDNKTFAPVALSIRYYLPLNSNLSRNKGFRVRCRALILGKYEHEDGKNIHVDYDGYLSYEASTISFSLESRPFYGERRKLFFFI